MQSGEGGIGFIPLGDFLTAEDPVWVWDVDARRILWANHAGRTLWGEPSLDVLRARRFKAQNKFVARLTALARQNGSQRDWSETLTLPVAEGERAIKCYMQMLLVAGNRPGLIVKALGSEKSSKTAEHTNKPPLPRKTVKSNSKSDRAPPTIATLKGNLPSKRQTLPVSGDITLLELPQVIARTPQEVKTSPAAACPVSTESVSSPALPETVHLMLRELCHELRNPLTVILGFSERIRDGGVRSAEKVQSYAGNIMESAELAMAVLADFSKRIMRPDAPQVAETVEIRSTVACCVRLISPLATQAKLKVTRSVAAHLPRLKIAERSLKQILLNVMMNAVRYQKTGSKLHVGVTKRRDGTVRIAISDDGIGMTKKEIRVAMGGKRPQVPVDPISGGSGLGLPLVKGLVEQANGTFSIESSRYKGTTIIITFPG